MNCSGATFPFSLVTSQFDYPGQGPLHRRYECVCVCVRLVDNISYHLVSDRSKVVLCDWKCVLLGDPLTVQVLEKQETGKGYPTPDKLRCMRICL